MKQIVIEGKSYNIDCNALTLILHNRLFKKGIIQDINVLRNYIIVQTLKANEIKTKFPKLSDTEIDNQVATFMNEYIDEFIEAITRITYSLIYTANDKIESYEDFLKGIKKLKIDDDWIVEVTEFAVDCFC